MGTVYLDGETVDFQGDAPATVAQVCSLLVDYLANAGRAPKSISVNEQNCDLEVALADTSSYEVLRFESQSVEEQLWSYCSSWSSQCREASQSAAELASSLLSISWTDTQRRCVDFVETLRPLLEGLGVLQEYATNSQAPWSSDFEQSFSEAISSVDRVADGLEAKDCVALSDSLALVFQKNWNALAAFIEETILAKSQEGGSNV